MGNPLERFLTAEPQQVDSTSNGVNPLSRFLPSTEQPNPLAQIASGFAPPEQPQTFLQAQGQVVADRAQRLEKWQELLARPDLQPAHRQQIERLMKMDESPTLFGVPVGNPVTDPNRPFLSNLARGVTHGTINYGILGGADFLFGAAQVALPKFMENMLQLPELREGLHDAQAIIKDWIDPQGWAGSIGTVAGTFLGPGGLAAGVRRGAGRLGVRAGTEGARTVARLEAVVNPFAVMNSTGMRALSRVSPKAAAIVKRGLEDPAATAFQRFSAHALGSGVVDAVQLVDVMGNDEMTDREKMIALAMTVLASGGSAALSALKRPVARIDPAEAEAAPKTPEQRQRRDEANKLVVKALDQQVKKEQVNKLRAAAKAEWEAKNLTKSWKKDLTKAERESIRQKYVDEHLPKEPVEGQVELFEPNEKQLDLFEKLPKELPAVEETIASVEPVTGDADVKSLEGPRTFVSHLKSRLSEFSKLYKTNKTAATLYAIREGITHTELAHSLEEIESAAAMFGDDFNKLGKFTPDALKQLDANDIDPAYLRVHLALTGKLSGKALDRLNADADELVSLLKTVEEGGLSAVDPKKLDKILKQSGGEAQALHAYIVRSGKYPAGTLDFHILDLELSYVGQSMENALAYYKTLPIEKRIERFGFGREDLSVEEHAILLATIREMKSDMTDIGKKANWEDALFKGRSYVRDIRNNTEMRSLDDLMDSDQPMRNEVDIVDPQTGETIVPAGTELTPDIIELIGQLGYRAVRVSPMFGEAPPSGPLMSREAAGPLEQLAAKRGEIPDDVFNKMHDGLAAVEGHLFGGDIRPSPEQIKWAKRAADYLGIDLSLPRPGEEATAIQRLEESDAQMIASGEVPQDVANAFQGMDYLGFGSLREVVDAVLDEPNWKMIWDLSAYPEQVAIVDQWRQAALAAQPRPENLDQLSRRLNRTEKQLRSERERRVNAERAADIDKLTGLGNKDAFLKLKDKFDADPNIEITIVDIGNFKAANDKRSMAFGDEMLVEAANALRVGAESIGVSLRAFKQGDEFFLIHAPGEAERIIAEARKLFQPRDIDGVVVGDLHVGKGSTFDEADRTLVASKAESIVPKYRDLSATEKGVAAPKAKGKRPPQPKAEIDFYGLKINKPLDKMTPKQRQRLQDKLSMEIDADRLSIEQYKKAVAEIRKYDKPADTPPAAEAPPPVVEEGGQTKDVDLTALNEQQRLLKLDKENARVIETVDLRAYRDDLRRRIKLETDPQERQRLTERLHRIHDEIARRKDNGGRLQINPAIVGAVSGYAAGLALPADDEHERARNAIYMALALGGFGALKSLKRASQVDVPDYLQNIRKTVKSVEDRPLDKREGTFTEQLRDYGNTLRRGSVRIASGLVRRDLGISQFSRAAGGYNRSAARSAGKQAEMFSLWRGRADEWIRGSRVGFWNKDGQFVPLDALTLSQISDMVKGRFRLMGELAAARREMELRGQENPRTTGIDLEDARKMYANSDEELHQGAVELHKFFRAARDMSVANGLLSREAAEKMDAQTFYVAIRRILGADVGDAPEHIDVKGTSIKKTASVPEALFKYLKGSSLPYQNPAEAAIDLIGRIHRANELNVLTANFFDEVATLPQDIRRLIVKRRLTGSEIPAIPDELVKIQALKKSFQESGVKMSDDEIRSIVHSLSPEPLNAASDVVKFYRNGKLEAYKVNDTVSRAFKALQPHEFSMLMESIKPVTKITNFARVGITANPVFVGYQAFRDIFQYYMNGSYTNPNASALERTLGAPVQLADSAIGSVMGYLNIMFNSKAVRDYYAAGAGSESVAGQGLQTVRGSVRRSTDLLDVVKGGQHKTQFHKIGAELGASVKQLSFRKLREAYASILSPIADAGRVGAYLKERGRGADVIEAIYRAKKAGANFANRGDSMAIMALDRMTLFLNPALQGIDASRHAFMRDPVGYVARGIIGLSLPSMYLWAAYKDDQEIVQLRATPFGKKFFWFRVNGEIMRVPKPLFDGQVFSSSVESWLDLQNEKDPLAVKNWADAMINDATVNLLPFIGVVPVSLASGKIYGLGSDIVPPNKQGLEIPYQEGQRTSIFARAASKVLSEPAHAIDSDALSRAVSPAGIDFIIRQHLGGLGSELATLFTDVVNVGTGGDWPAPDEMAFVRSVFGRSPSRGSAALREFYEFAERSEVAHNTLNYLIESNPDDLEYHLRTRERELKLVKYYAEGRQKILEYRKAYDDVLQMPKDLISDKDRRELSDLMLRSMVDIATQYNKVARELH